MKTHMDAEINKIQSMLSTLTKPELDTIMTIIEFMTERRKSKKNNPLKAQKSSQSITHEQLKERYGL